MFSRSLVHEWQFWTAPELIFQMATRPRRMPIVTASVRLRAPSLARTELTWNFTVCSETLFCCRLLKRQCFVFSEGAQGFSPAKIQQMHGALAPGLLPLAHEYGGFRSLFRGC